MKLSVAKKVLADTQAAYNQIAVDWDRTRHQLWPVFQSFLPYVKPGAQVLDVGCGNARLLELFTNVNLDYTGLDTSSQLLKIAAEKFPAGRFVTGDILQLPFADNTFDLVFCLATLHHVPGPLRQQAARELYRVLQPGGTLIMLNWWWLSWWGGGHRLAQAFLVATLKKIFGRSQLDYGDVVLGWADYTVRRYIHLFSRRSINRLLAQAGFSGITTTISQPSPRGFRNLVTIAKK